MFVKVMLISELWLFMLLLTYVFVVLFQPAFRYHYFSYFQDTQLLNNNTLPVNSDRVTENAGQAEVRLAGLASSPLPPCLIIQSATPSLPRRSQQENNNFAALSEMKSERGGRNIWQRLFLPMAPVAAPTGGRPPPGSAEPRLTKE